MDKTLTDLENETIEKAIPVKELFSKYDKIGLAKMRLSLLRIRKELKNKNTWNNFVDVLIETKWWIKFSKRKNILLKLQALHEKEKEELI